MLGTLCFVVYEELPIFSYYNNSLNDKTGERLFRTIYAEPTTLLEHSSPCLRGPESALGASPQRV